jgi:hypothetical protein
MNRMGSELGTRREPMNRMGSELGSHLEIWWGSEMVLKRSLGAL